MSSLEITSDMNAQVTIWQIYVQLCYHVCCKTIKIADVMKRLCATETANINFQLNFFRLLFAEQYFFIVNSNWFYFISIFSTEKKVWQKWKTF